MDRTARKIVAVARGTGSLLEIWPSVLERSVRRERATGTEQVAACFQRVGNAVRRGVTEVEVTELAEVQVP